MSKHPETVRVQCGRCGGGSKNHSIVSEHVVHQGNDEIDVWNTYQIIKCMGCDSVRFRQFETCSESRDYETGKLDEYDEAVFPETGHKNMCRSTPRDFPMTLGRCTWKR